MRHLQSLAKRFICSTSENIQFRSNRIILRSVALLLFFSIGIHDAISINCPNMDDRYFTESDQCRAYVFVPMPTSSDPLWLVDIKNDYNNTSSATDFYPIGLTRVKFTATYSNGTQEECSIEIDVKDGQPAQITCPSVPAVKCFTDDLDLYPYLNDFLNAGGMVSDNCDIDESSYRSNYKIISSNGNCSQSVEYSFSILDIYGNEGSCVFVQEFDDTENPEITKAPIYPDLVCGDDLPALDSTAITATDNCGIATISVTRSPDIAVACSDTEYTYTWIVTDNCGNSDSVSASFMVMASTDDPVIVGSPAPLSDLPCNSSFPPFQQLGASHCSGATIKIERIFTVDVCNGYPVTYRWTPISTCGVEGTPVEVVFNMLPDPDGPIIEDPMPIDDIECSEPLPDFEQLLAIDQCAQDDEAPVILGNCLNINACSRNRLDALVPLVIQATDNCAADKNIRYQYDLDIGDDGMVEESNTGQGSIIDLERNMLIGTHSVDVTFTDVAGNSDNCIIMINVTECVGPTVSCLPRAIQLEYVDTDNDGFNDSYGYNLNAAYLSLGAYDNMGNPLSVSFSQDPMDQELFLDCTDVGEKEIHLFVTDPSGNVDHCDTEILIVDALQICHNINGPAAFTRNEYVCSEPVEVEATMDPVNADPCTGYEVTYRYTAMNDCGVTSEKTVSFNVLPSKPEIMAPADYDLQLLDPAMCEMELTLEAAIPALGLCSPIVTYTTEYPNGTIDGNGGSVTLDAGINKIYYNAIDECGNTCVDSTTITIRRPCLLSCREQVNISVGSECETEIVASMVGSDIPVLCDYYYEIKAYDAHGNLIPNNIVSSDQIGENITVEIIDPLCNNTCWGYALIEDKFPPELVCGEPIIGSCLNYDVQSLPTVIDNCNNYVIKLTNESTQVMPCDPDYSMRVFRTYIAEDARNGTKSNACTQEILIQRINLDDIEFPGDKQLECQELYLLDHNGNPDPSVTGVPNLYGDDIYPVQPEDLCNTLVTYKDHIIEHGKCDKKIIRTWEATEWWCAKDSVAIGVQTIHIVDFEPPVFQCRYDTLIMTTNAHECVGYGYLPEVIVADNCSHEYEYLVEYPGGAMNTNGGFVELPVGLSTVTYTVFDECSNSEYCMVTVYVQDHTPPVPVCEEFKVISLPNNGWVDIKADIFDRGSRDECGIKKFEVRRMDTICNALDTLWGPTVSFCCDDVGNDDLMVAMRVTDWGGNHNTCMVNVKIQDKVNPYFTCPEDVTVYCDEPYNFSDLSLEFGKPTMTEVCTDLDYTEEVTHDVDQCGIGKIIRDFELERNGIAQACSQVITILNNTSYDYSQIVWPEDYIADQVCDLSDLDPEDLIYPYDEPYFPLAECQLVAMNYEDDVFEFVPDNDGCAKIHRIWTIINWCDKLENGNYATVQHTQVIKTLKTEAPIIEGNCDSLFYCNEDITCVPDSILLTNFGSDDCTLTEDLRWKFKIDFFQNGIYDTIGYNDSIFEFFPYGQHLVRWELMDNCSNLTKCDYIVDVRNCKAPSPVCINGLAADLVPMDLIDANGEPGQDGEADDEMVELWAIDFEASSTQVCNNPITFSFSPDTTDKFRIFDCDDIGINIIELWVTDVYTGAQDFCQTFIDIQDNNNVDVCENMGTRSNIYGSIFTEENREIKDVEVSLIGTAVDVAMSDLLGKYAFPNMTTGGQYYVKPNKDIEPLNGVSTLDLVLIQKHILGINTINSPYKLIAADVNKDGSVSAIDLIELRKLILGIYDDFPANESWRFVYQDLEFADPVNPWTQVLDEKYDIQSLNNDMEINFIGMKTGDVNASVELGIGSGLVNNRDADNFTVSLKNGLIKNGERRSILIENKDAIAIDGLQMSFEFDSDKIELLEIRGKELGISNVNTHNPFDDQINISWYNEKAQAIQLESKSTLLELEIIAKEDLEVSELINISDYSLSSEVYANGEVMPIRIEYYTDQISESNEMVLYQNVPNPWQAQTSIEFYIPADGLVEFRVYDNSGRLLKNIKRDFNAGNNSVIVKREELNNGGILLYELIYRNQLLTKRMLLLD